MPKRWIWGPCTKRTLYRSSIVRTALSPATEASKVKIARMRLVACIASGVFIFQTGDKSIATGVSVSLLLIASQDRPFSGEISVKPNLLCKSERSDLNASSSFSHR